MNQKFLFELVIHYLDLDSFHIQIFYPTPKYEFSGWVFKIKKV